MSGSARRSLVSPLIAGLLAGILIALVVGVMADINLTYRAPWAQAHVLGAQVSDADGMSVGSDVRIASNIGEVHGAVKSHHHQALGRVGDGLREVAWAEDGTVEGLEDPEKPFLVGVLWHPEAGEDQRLFEQLVEAARK